MSQSANRARDIKLAYSAEIIGAVVKALDLEHGVLKGKTARRFFERNYIAK